MQIIGKLNDGFILSASEREVAKLIGFQYDNNTTHSLRIGDDIQISELYHFLYAIAQEGNTMRESVEQIRKYLDKIEKVPMPILNGEQREIIKKSMK